jgi:hypothetical protein
LTPYRVLWPNISTLKRETNVAKAVKTFTGYTMDYTSQIQFAVSATGKVFRRMQYRSPYGYKWAKWSETVAAAIEGKSDNGPRGWRLPA